MSRHRLAKVARAKQAALALGDAAAAAAALGCAAPTSPGPVAAAACGWAAVLYAAGLYDFSSLRDARALARALAVALALDAALAAALLPAAAPAAAAAALAHGAFLVWRLAWLRLLRSSWACQRVLFLGDTALIRAMVLDISAGRHPGYRVAGWHRLERPPAEAPGIARWAPAQSSSAGALAATAPDALVIGGALFDERSFLAAFSLAAAAPAPAVDELDFYELLYKKIAPRRAARPEWLLEHALARRQLLYPGLKRALDATAAALGLLAAAPVLALAAAAVACDGGRVLYRQRRVGLLGREFDIWKLRTMEEGAEDCGPLCGQTRKQARVTACGAVLRRFHVDELPQLWNVLRGEMSLVGPRPEWAAEARLLEQAVPCYHLRHLVKPGITGWAQVNFRATNSPDDSVEKLRYDLYYLKHASTALDAAILLRTVKRAFQSDESFRVDEADVVGRGLNPQWGGA